MAGAAGPAGIFVKDEESARVESLRKQPTLDVDWIIEKHHRQYGNGWILGRENFNFLVSQGLDSASTVLDVGSGTLRNGLHLIQHLDAGSYCGVEADAVSVAVATDYEVPLHGLASKKPVLVASEAFEFERCGRKFDTALIFAVTIHLTPEQQAALFAGLERVLLPNATVWVTDGLPDFQRLANGGRKTAFAVVQHTVVRSKYFAKLETEWWRLRFDYIPATCGWDFAAADPAALLGEASSADRAEAAKVSAASLALARNGVVPGAAALGCHPRRGFIVGSGHSGTSLLLAMLDQHPGIRTLWETSRFFSPDALTAVQQWDNEACLAGETLWVEKTPSHICVLGRILDRVPEARVVVVVRDGREVTMSLLHERSDLFAGNNFTKALRRWIDDNAAGIVHRNKFPDDTRILRVRYEDIIRAPTKTLVAVCDHLGIAFDPAVLSPAAAQNVFALRKAQLSGDSGLADAEDHWKYKLSPEQLDIFEKGGGRAMNHLLLGYADKDHGQQQQQQQQQQQHQLQQDQKHPAYLSGRGATSPLPLRRTSSSSSSSAPVPFVVLAGQRTGSTALLSLLESVPGVSASGARELFLPEKKCPWHFKYGDAVIGPTIKDYLDKLYSRRLCLDAGDYFADMPENCKIGPCLERRGRLAAVGFKLMFDQIHYGHVRYFRENRDTRVIHLQRWNKLAVLVSEAVARVTHVFHFTPGADHAFNDGAARVDFGGADGTKKVSLDALTVIPWIKAKETLETKTVARVQVATGRPVLTVYYEDLFSGEGRCEPYCGIAQLLGLDCELFCAATPITSKIVASNHSLDAILANAHEVRDILKDTPYFAYVQHFDRHVAKAAIAASSSSEETTT